MIIMLSQVSMILSVSVLLMLTEPLGATQNFSSEEMDCYLEARLTTTAELIDSALRNMAKDFKKHLNIKNHLTDKQHSNSERNPANKVQNCSMCLKDCPQLRDAQPINCNMSETGYTGYTSSTCDMKPIDCSGVYQSGNHTNGQYIIWPKSWITNKPLLVYCDMETDGGGWTVIQRRGSYGNRSDSFYRDWNDYKRGFGNIEEEFWIGNDNLFALTNQRAYQIKFDLWSFNGTYKYAVYSEFRVADESQSYKLHVTGHSGTAGDAFSYHDGMMFTTKDKDNDLSTSDNCAVLETGAWWFNKCATSNLNGIYGEVYTLDNRYVFWNLFTGYRAEALKATNMKIRPLVS